jgi:hypothetical protein
MRKLRVIDDTDVLRMDVETGGCGIVVESYGARGGSDLEFDEVIAERPAWTVVRKGAAVYVLSAAVRFID